MEKGENRWVDVGVRDNHRWDTGDVVDLLPCAITLVLLF